MKGDMRANPFVLLLPVLLFAAFVWLAVGGLLEDKEGKTLVSSVGKTVPAMKLAVYGGQGFFTSEDMKGRKVLLNFFASWCVPCAEESEYLMALSKSASIPVYGIVYKDKEAPLKKYFEKHGNPYTRVALDDDGRAAIEWGVTGVPETFLIGEDGSILAHIAGPLTEELWEKYFAKLVAAPVSEGPKTDKDVSPDDAPKK